MLSDRITVAFSNVHGCISAQQRKREIKLQLTIHSPILEWIFEILVVIRLKFRSSEIEILSICIVSTMFKGLHICFTLLSALQQPCKIGKYYDPHSLEGGGVSLSIQGPLMNS